MEPIIDPKKAREILTYYGKKEGNGKQIKKTVRALIKLHSRGLLNVFPNGDVSLTEEARPLGEFYEKIMKACDFYSDGNCLVKNLQECFPPPTCTIYRSSD